MSGVGRVVPEPVWKTLAQDASLQSSGKQRLGMLYSRKCFRNLIKASPKGLCCSNSIPIRPWVLGSRCEATSPPRCVPFFCERVHARFPSAASRAVGTAAPGQARFPQLALTWTTKGVKKCKEAGSSPLWRFCSRPRQEFGIKGQGCGKEK